MLIKQLNIQNFKIYKNKKFYFGTHRLILISGANGFGKTTIFDAIEWCITGDIKRVSYNYKNRNKTKPEISRMQNRKGIIKYNNSNPDDKVKVELTLDIDGSEYVIYREQEEDDLYVKTELQFGDTVTDEIKSRINAISDKELYYNYHVCDINKTFRFLNSNRQEVKELFNNFINPHNRENGIKSILLMAHGDIKDKLDEIKKTESIIETDIEKIKEDIELLKSKIKIINYPQVRFYPEEDIKIENSNNLDFIINQKNKINTCGYNRIYSKLGKIILYYQTQKKASALDELLAIYKENKDIIDKTIEKSYYHTETLDKIEKRIEVISRVVKQVESTKQVDQINEADVLKIIKINEKDFLERLDKVKSLYKVIKQEQQEIRQKEEGNDIIRSLSNLVIGRKGFLEYKNEGNKSCPLCGSKENFENICKVEEIAIQAKQYIDNTNNDIIRMKEKEQEKSREYNEALEDLKLHIVTVMKLDLRKQINNKEQFSKHYNETKEFFGKGSDVGININENFISNIKSKRSELEKSLSNTDIIDRDLPEVINIVNALELVFDFEEVNVIKLNKLKQEVDLLRNKSIEVINFNFEDFNKKLMFLDNLINNNEICDKSNVLDKHNKELIKIRKVIDKYETLKEKCRDRANKIGYKLNVIENQELESVGPYLYKIYSKLIKNTNIKDIRLEADRSTTGERGAVLSDNKDRNIMNVLSQGQLGVLMLSYFIANMFLRGDKVEFKSYFVDDITSVLDDMNVLSFIDFIKYQLDNNLNSENTVINQFFFATCDEAIERNFIHKMDSFHIDWINFKFSSYSKIEIKRYEIEEIQNY